MVIFSFRLLMLPITQTLHQSIHQNHWLKKKMNLDNNNDCSGITKVGIIADHVNPIMAKPHCTDTSMTWQVEILFRAGLLNKTTGLNCEPAFKFLRYNANILMPGSIKHLVLMLVISAYCISLNKHGWKLMWPMPWRHTNECWYLWLSMN